MIKVFINLDPQKLEKILNDLGPSAQILEIYSINQNHFAWVKLIDPQKSDKKGKK